MKKSVLFCFLIAFLILAIFPSVNAAVNTTTEQQKIDKAYYCLNDKTNSTKLCNALTPEEKIFTVLANGNCQNELINTSFNESECWPAGNCRTKTTAQAILALDNAGINTDRAQKWLISRTRGTTDLEWFLEIESTEATTCTLEYSSNTYDVTINLDKKISGDGGVCLSVDESGYWLRINPSCFDEEFAVSCDQGFLTTLLFKKPDSSTIHVSPESSSATAGGTTSEKVESFCFVDNGVCNYEGSLWASVVLDANDEDVTPYLPYLITLAEDNEEFLPEAFLYFINSNTDYRNSLLSKQKIKKWWFESGDKIYDTSLALYPFQRETLEEKTNSQAWLLSIQDTNGCWENNVRNTAFVLASLWPRSFGHGSSGSGGTGTTPSCTSSHYFCVSTNDCTDSGGKIFSTSEYQCSGLYRCCSVAPKESTCLELGGDACSSSQRCGNGGWTDSSASGLKVGETCCIGGACQAKTGTGGDDGSTLSECESSGGSCRVSSSCNSGEEENTLYGCSYSSEICCVQKTTSTKNYAWVWILLILIILVVLAIIFRNKLRMLWLKISKKSGAGSSSSSKPGFPRFPPSTSQNYPMRVPERRILLPVNRPPQRPIVRPKSGAQKELDEVLRKLKEMGK